LRPSDVKYFVPVVLVCAVWRRSRAGLAVLASEPDRRAGVAFRRAVG